MRVRTQPKKGKVNKTLEDNPKVCKDVNMDIALPEPVKTLITTQHRFVHVPSEFSHHTALHTIHIVVGMEEEVSCIKCI